MERKAIKNKCDKLQREGNQRESTERGKDKLAPDEEWKKPACTGTARNSGAHIETLRNVKVNRAKELTEKER